MKSEFAFGREPFRLVAEETLDGDRVKRERERRDEDRRHAESKQKALFDEHQVPGRAPGA